VEGKEREGRCEGMERWTGRKWKNGTSPVESASEDSNDRGPDKFVNVYYEVQIVSK
jgi:hypothetical protein